MNGMFKSFGWCYDKDPDGGGGNPDEKADPKPTAFAEWIKTQPQDVQDAYAGDIRGLRSALDKERGNGDELKKTQARLKELEDAEAERTRAQLSKEELLTKDLEAAQSKAAGMESELKTLHIQQAVEREATKLRFADPEDAMKMIDLSKLTLTDGKITGVKEALEELAKTKPYLIRAQDDKSNPGNKTRKGPRTNPEEDKSQPHVPLVHL